MEMFRSLAVLFLSSAVCFACDCVPTPACGGIHSGAHYFIGTPTSRRVIPGDAGSESIAVYTVKVIEQLSDSAPPIGETEVRTGTGGADCSWHFRIGEPYLFETYSSKSGDAYTSLCTWTGELKNSQVLVRTLRSLKGGKSPPSLLGEVVRWNIDADEAKDEEAYQGLTGISVTVRSQDGKSWRAMSDKQGIVTFESLPPGEYVISPDFPQSLVLWRGQNIGKDFSRVIIPASSGSKQVFCRAYLEGIPSSGIEGNVVASGRTVRNAVVAAWLLKNGTKREILDGFPENGRFQLLHLPAGTYQITLSEDYGKHRLAAYTQTVVVRDAAITEITLAPKAKIHTQ